MNKLSLQNKILEAKKKTQDALAAGKASPEVLVAVESLLLVIEILSAVFLEKTTRKNSSNSGLPPSKNEGSNGNRNQGSGDRAALGDVASNTRQLETSETVSPLTCSHCDEDLQDVKVKTTDARIKVDILYEVVTHTVTSEVKECPQCHELTKGRFPEGMDGKLQYGDGIKAAIINFLCVQMMSLQRCQEHMMGMLGKSLSQAIMLKYLSQFSESLKTWEEKQIQNILKCKVIHCDETSVRINKVNFWVHSYSSGVITLKFVHRNRGREAIDDFNITPRFKGIIVHDSLASYFAYDHVTHGLCGGHLLRELKFIEESNGYLWATKLKEILLETLEIVNSRPGVKRLRAKEYKRLQSRYRNALTRGLVEMPSFPGKSTKRGKATKSQAQNLWCRLKEYEDAVLLFARVKEVDFTNNRAERDLRITKVKQKMSGCFRTYEMAEVFYRISSYIKSMKYRGYSSIEAISLALQGKIPL